MSSVNKILARKENKSQKIIQTQTQEILSWFGSLDLHSVPKQPA